MANPTSTSRATSLPTAKRRKLSHDHHQSLLPGLPDHITQICLSLISPTVLYSVCRSWRRLIYSATFPPFRSIYTLSLPGGGSVGCAATTSRRNQTLKISSFDPVSSKWITIQSPPYNHRLAVRKPSYISRNLPIQSVSVCGSLVLIAATSFHRNSPFSAFPHPLIFNPLSNTWSSGPPLSTPRRWCAAGVFQETVVVASGIGSTYTETVARTVEKWVFRKIESFDQKRSGNFEKIQSLRNSNVKIESFDQIRRNPARNCKKIQSFDKISDGNPEKIRYLMESLVEKTNGNWEKMQSLKTSKLCREAIDAIGFKRKLCMVNVKGDYTKEGFIYNLDFDNWSEMPAGMLGGWRGPAAAMDEETLYVIDETKGVLKKYNDDVDNWSEVLVDERFKTAEYIAAGGGRVCVVCETVGVLVVDVVANPPRLWVVETPPGDEILGIHILPRMCLPEYQSPVGLLESKE